MTVNGFKLKKRGITGDPAVPRQPPETIHNIKIIFNSL